VVKEIKRILRQAKEHGVNAGIHCASSEYAKKMLKTGFDLVTLSVDYRILGAAAAEMVKQVR
jgi:4-hydroxy-2-oxoheptanedioate aldolase